MYYNIPTQYVPASIYDGDMHRRMHACGPPTSRLFLVSRVDYNWGFSWHTTWWIGSAVLKAKINFACPFEIAIFCRRSLNLVHAALFLKISVKLRTWWKVLDVFDNLDWPNFFNSLNPFFHLFFIKFTAYVLPSRDIFAKLLRFWLSRYACSFTSCHIRNWRKVWIFTNETCFLLHLFSQDVHSRRFVPVYLNSLVTKSEHLPHVTAFFWL